MKSLRKILVTLLLVATLFTVTTPSTCLFAEGNAIMPISTSTIIKTNTLDFWDSIYNQGPKYYNMGSYYVYIYPNYSNGTIYFDLTVDPISAQTSEVILAVGSKINSTDVLDVSKKQNYGGANEISDTLSAKLEIGKTYYFVLYFSMGKPTDPDAYGTARYIGNFKRTATNGVTQWEYNLS